MNFRTIVPFALIVAIVLAGCHDKDRVTCAFDPSAAPAWDVDTIAVAQDVTVNGIWGVNRDEIYAAGMVDSGQGKIGVVWKYDGATWNTAYSRPNADLRDIHGTTSADIWIAGMDNPSSFPSGYPGESLILHWNGTAWQESYVDPSLPGLFAVWSDGEDVYACGRRGTCLHFDGASWSPEAVMDDYPADSDFWDLNDIWGVGRSANRELYIATTLGGASIILHKEDGAWDIDFRAPSRSYPPSRFVGVWARDRSEVYSLEQWAKAIAPYSSLYRRANTTWDELLVEEYSSTYWALRGDAGGDIFALSRRVARLEGGNLVSYTGFSGYGPTVLNDLWVDGHDVYVAGNNGGVGVIIFGDFGGTCGTN